MQALQAEWKAIGPVPRGHEKATWDRFRTACDQFFTRRLDDLKQRKEQWGANLAKKEALCASAEAHSSIPRAAQILGLGDELLRRVPADAAGAMSLDALEAAVVRDRAEGYLPAPAPLQVWPPPPPAA